MGESEKENKKKLVSPGRGKRTILSIAIAILFVMFIAYAIESIYNSPKYDDYCKDEFKQFYNQTDCEANGGVWNDYGVKAPQNEPQVTGYCDLYSKCSKEYESARESYNRNVFFISVAIGIITIIISVLLKLESVSLGFMAGGVILVIYGTIRYWGNLSDILRTIMLGFALAVLVWIGYKFLKE